MKSSDTTKNVNKLIETLVNPNELNIYMWYEEILTMYENELAKHAPVLSNKGNFNKHRKPKPFWTTELNNLWKNVVEKERIYIKTVGRQEKLEAKLDYNQSLKEFDRNSSI